MNRSSQDGLSIILLVVKGAICSPIVGVLDVFFGYIDFQVQAALCPATAA